MIITLFMLQLIGWLGLTMAMQKHFKQAAMDRFLRHAVSIISTKLHARIIGWVSLTASLIVTIRYADILSIALVTWWCTLSMALLLVSLYFSRLSK